MAFGVHVPVNNNLSLIIHCLAGASVSYCLKQKITARIREKHLEDLTQHSHCLLPVVCCSKLKFETRLSIAKPIENVLQRLKSGTSSPRISRHPEIMASTFEN